MRAHAHPSSALESCLKDTEAGRMRVPGLASALAAVVCAATPALASAHTITEYHGSLAGNAGPLSIAAGDDGALWFSDDKNHGAIGRITTGGTITEYTTGLTRDASYGDMTSGPGGVWFTETN